MNGGSGVRKEIEKRGMAVAVRLWFFVWLMEK